MVYTPRYHLISPEAPFFLSCISEADLDELNVEIIRNTLYKVCFMLQTLYCSLSPKEYIESFYKFCEGLGGVTAEVMCEILAVSEPVLPVQLSYCLSVRG